MSSCGSSSGPSTAEKGGKQELLLVSYAVTKGAYDKILPKFAAEWKAKTGQEIKIRTSYGGSGTQTLPSLMAWMLMWPPWPSPQTSSNCRMRA